MTVSLQSIRWQSIRFLLFWCELEEKISSYCVS